MKRFLTAADIANNVRMNRTLHSGAILIVEGDIDSRVYNRFCDQSSCLVIPAHGKDNTIGALALLEADQVHGVLAIVDSDFWRLDGINPTSPNLLQTDTHDIETMILRSKALGYLLGEFGSASSILKLGKPVHDLLLERTLPIGFVRWISGPSKDNLGLKFDGLDFNKFVDPTNLTVDVGILLKELKANSSNPGLNDKNIKAKITVLQNQRHDAWQVCSGHDLVQILCIGLVNVFGNQKALSLNFETLERSLRLAYDYTLFKSTALCNYITIWEQNNQPFKVLS